MKVYILIEQTTGICSAYKIIEVFTTINGIKCWMRDHEEYLVNAAKLDALHVEDISASIDKSDTLVDINKLLRPAVFVDERKTYDELDALIEPEHLCTRCEDPSGKQYYISTEPISPYSCTTTVNLIAGVEIASELYTEANDPWEARERHLEIVNDIQSGAFFIFSAYWEKE